MSRSCPSLSVELAGLLAETPAELLHYRFEGGPDR
jgi:hypothetical protein